MKEDSLGKLGGTCSILLGLSYIVVGISYLLLPAEQRALGDVEFLASFAASPAMLTLQWWAFALGGVVGIAAVLAISRSVQAANEGWVAWTTSTLAIVGFVLTTLDKLRSSEYWSFSAAAYNAAADDAARAQVVEQSGLFGLDVNGWFGFGAVGLWVLVVSLLALRTGALPKLLTYAGLGVTAAYWLVVLRFVLGVEPLIAIAAGLGGVVLAPIWFIWNGLRLRGAMPAIRAMQAATG
jgi:hypothetical protein